MRIPHITWREMNERFKEFGVEIVSTRLGWKYHRKFGNEHYFYPTLKNLDKLVTLGVLASICEALQLDVRDFLEE